jgi:hypothetical protein
LLCQAVSGQGIAYHANLVAEIVQPPREITHVPEQSSNRRSENLKYLHDGNQPVITA